MDLKGLQGVRENKCNNIRTFVFPKNETDYKESYHMNFNLGQFQKIQNGLLIFGLFYCEIKSNKIFHSHSYIGFLRISEDVQLRRKPI